MRPAREMMPTTGKKAPPLSPLLVAMRLALLAADSRMDPSIIMLGAVWAERVDAVDWVREQRGWGEMFGAQDVNVERSPNTEASRRENRGHLTRSNA